LCYSSGFNPGKDSRTDFGGYTVRILVINGPNINMLGLREPELYGNKNYTALVEFIQSVCADAGVEAECMQSNHEGAIVDAIQAAYGHFNGIVINPAAYTHTSIAILDALKAVGIPAVEVHLTNIQEREAYRQISFTAQACEKTFAGMGFEGYAEAIRYLVSTYAS
jgi:3-dehydroquinate dehydratase-2